MGKPYQAVLSSLPIDTTCSTTPTAFTCLLPVGAQREAPQKCGGTRGAGLGHAADPLLPDRPPNTTRATHDDFMGFSVRSARWRYTIWLPWDGMEANWTVRTAPRELYDYDPYSLYNIDRMDYINRAYQIEHQATANCLHRKLMRFFRQQRNKAPSSWWHAGVDDDCEAPTLGPVPTSSAQTPQRAPPKKAQPKKAPPEKTPPEKAPLTSTRCLRVADHEFDQRFADQLDQSGNARRKSTEADCLHLCHDASSEYHSWCVGIEFRDTENGMCELYDALPPRNCTRREEAAAAAGYTPGSSMSDPGMQSEQLGLLLAARPPTALAPGYP